MILSSLEGHFIVSYFSDEGEQSNFDAIHHNVGNQDFVNGVDLLNLEIDRSGTMDDYWIQ